MAGRIQGITVEIGSDTTKLQTALKGVNKESSESQPVLQEILTVQRLVAGQTFFREQSFFLIHLLAEAFMARSL